MRLVSLLLLAVATLVQDTPLTPRERVQINNWLTCIDCRTELDTLRALAVRRPVATVDTLAAALLLGPSAASRVHSESLVVRGYIRDSLYLAQRQQPLLPDGRDSVVARRLRRFVEGYQARAALGLGWIHTPRAVLALESSIQVGLPAGVQRAAVYARDSLP